jgi:hypothetical protein
MTTNRRWKRVSVACALIALFAITPLAAHHFKIFDYPFGTPVFGIATGFDGSLLVADARGRRWM